MQDPRRCPVGERAASFRRIPSIPSGRLSAVQLRPEVIRNEAASTDVISQSASNDIASRRLLRPRCFVRSAAFYGTATVVVARLSRHLRLMTQALRMPAGSGPMV